MKRKSFSKTTAATLAFLLVLLSPVPATPLFASVQDPFVPALDPANDTGAAVSTTHESEVGESVLSDFPASDATAGFLAGGPLSRAEGEEEQVLLESNDPFYSSSGSWGQSYADLWWLKRVDADDAWAYSRGTGVPVAVIDTGLDFNHPDIASNIWTNQAEALGLPGVDDDGNGFVDDLHGWDYYNWDNNPWDDNGHGTHVSGIIGAVADNAEGIAGIAPESKIIPIKVLNAGGSGYVTDVINAIRYAADLGAKVINLSLGVFKNYLSRSLQNAFQSAVSYAKDKGSIVVAAAGNDNGKVENSYPAGIPDVIAVGATDANNKRAWFSNFGKLLDFTAPGVDVLSLKAGGVSFGSSSVVDPDYVRASGTSMASPVVAGVVALLRAIQPLFSFDQILSRLRSTATDLGSQGFDSYYGYGLINALGAVTGSSSAATSSVSGSTSTSSAGSSHSKKNGTQAKGHSFDNLPAADAPADFGRNLYFGVPASWFSAFRSENRYPSVRSGSQQGSKKNPPRRKNAFSIR